MNATSTLTLGSGLNPDCVPDEPRKWLRAKRDAALSAFNKSGLPTRRDEAWRFTNLKKLGVVEFAHNRDRDDQIDLGAVQLIDTEHRIVFVNGVLDRERSSFDSLPEGVRVATLDTECKHFETLLKQTLGELTAINDDAFAALNTALFDDLVAVHIKEGTTLDSPLYVLSIVTGDAPVLTNPRTLIVAEDSTNITVIEDFVSTGTATHFTNALTEVFIGADADVTHYTIERENLSAFNISTLKSKQKERSRFSSHTILLGGGVVRNNVHPIIDGEECWLLLNGIYLGDGGQHMDNHMRVEHRQPHCDSRQYYKGVLREKAHGVFCGRIVVSPGAQKTDAVQSSQGLLLSKSSQIQNQPQLEIYADDVKCTHGATVGELDHNALFYLQSRGIDKDTARALMVFAFIAESLGRIENKALRDAITTLILDKLPDSSVLHNVVSGAA